jgi:LPXTG-motif cell wall-anchored protein
MKRIFLMITLTLFLINGRLIPSFSQDQPKPKKDTVNIDTDAKPVFYYAAEEEKGQSKKGSGTTVVIIAGIVVIAGAAGFFFSRKRKN